MTIINMRDFLDIETDKTHNKKVSDNEDDESDSGENQEWYFSFPDPRNSDKILNMKVKEMDNRWYELQYFEIVNESSIENTMNIEISPGELKTLQILIR